MRFSMTTKTQMGYVWERISVDKAYVIILQTCLLLLFLSFIFFFVLSASSQKWESQAHTFKRSKSEEHGSWISYPSKSPGWTLGFNFPYYLCVNYLSGMSLKITVPDLICQLSYTLQENYASLPMQFLGPAENGRNAKGWRPLIFSGRKRSGSKSNGAGHTSGFLCKARVEMVTADPFGRKKSPEANAVIC